MPGDPPGSLAFPVVLTTKKTVGVIKTIVKARNPEEDVETEVTDSETLNLQILFRKILINLQVSFWSWI